MDENKLAEKVVADIRNKMGYAANLVSLLRAEPSEWVEGRIFELIPKVEESLEYLRKLDINQFK